MRDLRRVGRAGVLVAVLALALAVMAGAAAAAPTVDSSSTDATSTTSDVTDGATITYFEANASNVTYIEGNFSTDSPAIEIIDPDTGVVHASNDSTGMKETAATEDHYAWNITHDELATIPMDAGENKSVTIKLINNESASNPATTTITVYLEGQDDRAVVYAGAEAASGNVTGLDANTEVDDGIFGFGGGDATTTVDASDVGMGANTSGTTLNVIVANTSGEDPFSQAAEGGFLTSTSEGDFVAAHQLQIQGHNHAVFHESAPDAVADGYTYGEATSINGEDAYVVHVADDYDGEANLDVTTVANDKYRVDKRLGVRTDAYGGYINALTASTGGAAVGLTAG